MSETEKPTRKQRTRGNRDAKPYKRSSDGKWVAIAYYPNGKRKPCYGKTAKEAAEARKQFYRDLEEGGPITVGRGTKLDRYLRQWIDVTLEQRVAAGVISPSTRDSYRDLAEKHIIPELGRIELTELAPAHLRPWLMKLQKKLSGRQRRKLRPGETELPPPALLKPRTIALCHAVLRKALNDALDEELVKRNVALLVAPPVAGKGGKTKIQPPTIEEASQLLAAAADDRLWIYWLTLLALGLRRGEGLGLRWENVDFEAGTIRLEKSIQRIRGEKDPETGRRKGKLVEKELKTEASHDTMAAPKMLMEALEAHREAQAAEREAACVWADPGLLFTTTVGTPLEPRNVNRSWEAVCERSGIGRHVRLHDLRHAAGSFLFNSGVDLKVVQKTLRHTRMATTADIYTHVFEETQREAAESMNGVLVDLQKRRQEKQGQAAAG